MSPSLYVVKSSASDRVKIVSWAALPNRVAALFASEYVKSVVVPTRNHRTLSFYRMEIVP